MWLVFLLARIITLRKNYDVGECSSLMLGAKLYFEEHLQIQEKQEEISEERKPKVIVD